MSLLGLAVAAALAMDGATVVPDAAGMQLDASAEGLAQEAFAALEAGQLEQAASQFGALAQAGAGPTARYLQGLALYELGDLRGAERALTGLEGASALNLRGLVRVERGQQAEGVALLEAAARAGDPQVAAHARLNLALVALDRGELDTAARGLEAATREAQALADPALARSAQSGLAALALARGERPPGQVQGLDAGLSAVGDLLGRGEVAAAGRQAELMRTQARTRREQVLAGLAQGAWLRASGQPEAAARALTDTLAQARALGLSRETAQALASLAVAHAQAGRLDVALSLMGEAEDTALAAGQLAYAQQLGAEVGLLALRQERPDAAASHLAELRRRGGTTPEAEARVRELEAGVAAADGRPDAAALAYAQAVAWYEAHGRSADAARAAVSCAAALEGSDPEQAAAWGRRALAAFERAGDPLGPAHLALARGLARARAGDLTGALRRFAEATELAQAQDSPQARQLAATAQANAARALVGLGASPEGAQRSASEGVDALVAHQSALVAALALYDQGLAAYNAGRYTAARAQFAESQRRLLALGERAYADQARRAAAWAAYNVAVGLDPQQSWPFWAEILGEAQQLDDVELHARAAVAQAVCAQRLGMPTAAQNLQDAAKGAEGAGLPELAAQAWAARADAPLSLAERAGSARRALALAPQEPASAYAMYSVAVDAYNQDQPELARALAEEVLPRAGSLRDAVEGVLRATGGL